jgi:hypothetical protein
MRRIEAELAQQEIEEKQAAAKQVFMTNKGDDAGQTTSDLPSQAAHDGDVGKEQGDPPPAADPAMEQLPKIQGGPRLLQPTIPVVHHPEDFTTPMDKVVYGTLGDPITTDYIRVMNDLEQKRRAILKKAKRVKKMGEKLDGDIARAQDTLKCARNMEEKYATLIQNQINEGGDPQLARNLKFTVPTAETLARMYIKIPPYVDKNRDEVRATPIENIVATKELLENNQSPAALEMAVKLMTKALVQQEKATSSQRLESDPALCRSSTASKARGNGNHGTRPDNESHIGSSEAQRREAHNRVDAIPISSDDRPHGKGHQSNPSPPQKNYPAYGYHQDKAPPRHNSNMPQPKYKTFEIPQGGIVIRDNNSKRGRIRDAGRRDEPPRRETSRDGGSKHREPSRYDNGAHRSGDKDKHRSSRHRDDKGQGSRRHDDDPAPRRAEGSHCSCRDPLQDVESKRCDGPARSHPSRKNPQDQKPYEARTHLNEIAKSQTAFFLGPKCFGQWIHDEPIPHGFKIEKNIRQYNGVEKPLTWLQDYFNAVQFAAGSPNVAVRYLPLMLSSTAR